jgi:hypothetical protein
MNLNKKIQSFKWIEVGAIAHVYDLPPYDTLLYMSDMYQKVKLSIESINVVYQCAVNISAS